MKKLKEIELFIPIKDYEEIESDSLRKKKLIFSMIFIFFSTVLFLFSNIENKIDFFLGFIDTELNIVSLLLSFSIAYLTILITTSGNNIDILKKIKMECKVNTEEISAYKYLLIELTFSIYLEILLLFILIINKFIVHMDFLVINYILFLAELIILLDILYIILYLVKNMYLAFYKE